MKLNPNELPETIKRLNPQLFAAVGTVEKPKRKPDPVQALDCSQAPQRPSPKGAVVCVSMCSYRRRQLDEDNLVAGLKPLRDGIAYLLNIDDADPRVRWEYGQVETRGEQGVMVKIELLQ